MQRFAAAPIYYINQSKPKTKIGRTALNLGFSKIKLIGKFNKKILNHLNN